MHTDLLTALLTTALLTMPKLTTALLTTAVRDAPGGGGATCPLQWRDGLLVDGRGLCLAAVPYTLSY